jgi:hypothetical protein
MMNAMTSDFIYIFVLVALIAVYCVMETKT